MDTAGGVARTMERAYAMDLPMRRMHRACRRVATRGRVKRLTGP